LLKLLSIEEKKLRKNGMTSLLHRLESELTTRIVDVEVSGETVTVALDDHRKISFPMDWSPRLKHGTIAERSHWELIGGGIGIHWPDLDEDLSLAGILLGLPSGESRRSFSKWLEHRQKQALC